MLLATDDDSAKKECSGGQAFTDKIRKWRGKWNLPLNTTMIFCRWGDVCQDCRKQSRIRLPDFFSFSLCDIIIKLRQRKKNIFALQNTDSTSQLNSLFIPKKRKENKSLLTSFCVWEPHYNHHRQPKKKKKNTHTTHLTYLHTYLTFYSNPNPTTQKCFSKTPLQP